MRLIQGVLALKVKGSVSDNGKRFTFCGNADNSLIALISGAGCLGSGSAGVFLFWKFPEFVKCARRSVCNKWLP